MCWQKGLIGDILSSSGKLYYTARKSIPASIHETLYECYGGNLPGDANKITRNRTTGTFFMSSSCPRGVKKMESINQQTPDALYFHSRCTTKDTGVILESAIYAKDIGQEYILEYSIYTNAPLVNFGIPHRYKRHWSKFWNPPSIQKQCRNFLYSLYTKDNRLNFGIFHPYKRHWSKLLNPPSIH